MSLGSGALGSGALGADGGGVAANTLPTGSVVISGVPQQGNVLSLSEDIADVDGLGTFSYQWYRDDVIIGGGTSSTYTLVLADVGALINVAISYTDGLGYSESVASGYTQAIVGLGDTYYECVDELTIDDAYVVGGSSFTGYVLQIRDENINAGVISGLTKAVNGGANLRLYSDAALTVRLPLDLSTDTIGTTEFNTGTGNAEFYTRIPMLPPSTPTKIYLAYGDPDDVQPASDEAFGSDAVWATYTTPTDPSDLKDTYDNNHTIAAFLTSTDFSCLLVLDVVAVASDDNSYRFIGSFVKPFIQFERR